MNSSAFHAQHRKRVRERFLKNSISAFENHEILEVLMYFVITRKNTNDIAHSLLDRFGNLANVLTADPSELHKIEGVGEVSAFYLNFLGEVYDSLGTEIYRNIPLNNEDRIGMYAAIKIGISHHGSALAAYLDGDGRLISEEWLYMGKEKMIDDFRRHVIKNAKDVRAKYIALAHDHRKEVLEPSPEDLVYTEDMHALAKDAGIKLWHVIVSDNEYTFI